MSISESMLSSKTVEWSTPPNLYARLNRIFGFTLDPCSTHDNHKCDKYYTIKEDGLKQSWRGERVFMNPPYGRDIGRWMQKAAEEARGGALVVCLVPARTDTEWWHVYCRRAHVIYLRGRLKFGGCENSAPFPNALVILTGLEGVL